MPPKFFSNGPIPATFFIFVFPHCTIQKIDESVDGVLGTQTQSSRMEGTDESTEQWQHSIFSQVREAYLNEGKKKNFTWKKKRRERKKERKNPPPPSTHPKGNVESHWQTGCKQISSDSFVLNRLHLSFGNNDVDDDERKIPKWKMDLFKFALRDLLLFLLCHSTNKLFSNTRVWVVEIQNVFKKLFQVECRKSSVDLFAPSILPTKFESQAHHLRFYQFIFEYCRVEKTKINKTRP